MTNTKSLKEYLDGKWRDQTKTVVLTDEDRLIEGFFLALRTSAGVSDLTRYTSILVEDYTEKITDLVDQ
ncbi:MAG: hypothetical protein H6766_00660 [Candidatus Peribacteria bacterium]|nr:MAG: hypothetical protein H6766_00660 [Candidatus Peribacteria bacterium]